MIKIKRYRFSFSINITFSLYRFLYRNIATPILTPRCIFTSKIQIDITKWNQSSINFYITISTRDYFLTCTIILIPHPRCIPGVNIPRCKYLTSCRGKKHSLLLLPPLLKNYQHTPERFQENISAHKQTTVPSPSSLTIQMTGNNETRAKPCQTQETRGLLLLPREKSTLPSPPRPLCFLSRLVAAQVVARQKKTQGGGDPPPSPQECTVDNGNRRPSSRRTSSRVKSVASKNETFETSARSRIVFSTLFTPVVDDFLALPPRNGPPGLRFFAYYRREGRRRRLRGLAGPPPIHRMNERMNGRGAFRGRYPKRRIADPDGRLGHPLPSPPLPFLPSLPDFGGGGGGWNCFSCDLRGGRKSRWFDCFRV